jgi:peptide/nickel transport system substrate-binding protein
MTTGWNRRRRIWFAVAAAAVLAAVATIVVVRGHHHPAPVAIDDCGTCPGYATCGTDPDNCDSGDRLPGGTIVVAAGTYPRGWNAGSRLGSVGDTAEQETPILPSAYVILPSGRFQYNKDLLVNEPQVVGQSPQRVVYHLNPAAVWNDGSGHRHPVSAQDFVFAWREYAGHDKRLPVDPSITGYDRIASVVGSNGDQTVTVTFRTTYSDWRGLFTRMEPYWFAAAATGAGSDHATRMTDAQIEKSFATMEQVPKFSAGPFMIRDVEPDGSTIEVPNPLWYGHDKPTLTQITFRPTDDNQNVALLQNREIGVFTSGPDPETANRLAGSARVNFHVEAATAWEQLQFNTRDSFLRDPTLREAIMDAIDIQGLVDHTLKPFFPDAKVLYSHNLFPGMAGYEDITKSVDRNEGTGAVARAEKLLTDARYTGVGRAGGLRTPGGQSVTISFVHTDNALRDASAGLIGEDIARLGITVTDAPTADLYGTLTNHDFGVAEFGLVDGALLGDRADWWTAHGGANLTGWSDPASDALLAQVARTLDNVQQANLLNQQDEILTAAHVDLPLYRSPVLIALDPTYINIRLNPFGYITYNTQQWGLFKQ